MAYAGQVLENPISGAGFVFRKTSGETSVPAHTGGDRSVRGQRWLVRW
jgi:hypothetical protein